MHEISQVEKQRLVSVAKNKVTSMLVKTYLKRYKKKKDEIAI